MTFKNDIIVSLSFFNIHPLSQGQARLLLCKLAMGHCSHSWIAAFASTSCILRNLERVGITTFDDKKILETRVNKTWSLEVTLVILGEIITPVFFSYDVKV